METLLALGLVVSPSTQLRFGDMPLGMGEILLVLWLGFAIGRQLIAPTIRANRAFRRVATFWLVFVFVECVGMIVGLLVEPFQDYGGMLHDMLAYSLLIVISWAMSLDLDLIGSDRRRGILWWMVSLGAVSMLMQIATGNYLISIPGVDPWYYDRLRGWAHDPNQLGFFALILVVLAMYLADTARDAIREIIALALGVPPLIVGLLSQSDSFVVGLMVAVAVFTTMKSVSWLRNVDMGPTLRGATVVLALLSLPLTLAAAVPFWSAAVQHIEQDSDSIYAKDNQGDARLALWKEAIEKGMESGLIGFGPGPHLTAKSYKRPPPDKFEAHNAPLELLTQGGFIASLMFVWISAMTFSDTWRAQIPALAALTICLSVFSMFHFVVRHPIFWFAVVLCLLEAARKLESSHRYLAVPVTESGR